MFKFLDRFSFDLDQDHCNRWETLRKGQPSNPGVSSFRTLFYPLHTAFGPLVRTCDATDLRYEIEGPTGTALTTHLNDQMRSQRNWEWLSQSFKAVRIKHGQLAVIYGNYATLFQFAQGADGGF